MKECDSCEFKETLYDGKSFCQHIQSMKGLEAEEEYVECDGVEECRYHIEKPNEQKCFESNGENYPLCKGDKDEECYD